jgi:hypothetical protein
LLTKWTELVSACPCFGVFNFSGGAGFPKNLSLLSPRAQLNLQRPSQLAYSSVVAIDLVCVIVAVMIISFFLNALKRDEIKR